MIRAVRVLFALVILIGAAACGDGDGEPPPDGTESPDPTPARTVNPGQHGPIAEGEYTFEGALKLTGNYTVLYPFSDPEADTCAEIAGEDAVRYVVPLPTFKEERRFIWTAGLKEYGGPGKYDLADLDRVTVEIRMDQEAEPVTYSSRDGSTATLTVDKDNKGSLVFKGLRSESDDDTLSGTARWTCTEASD